MHLLTHARFMCTCSQTLGLYVFALPNHVPYYLVVTIRLHMYVCLYLSMYVCIYVCMHMHACTHECKHVCMDVFMYVFIYVFMYAYSKQQALLYHARWRQADGLQTASRTRAHDDESRTAHDRL